MYSQQNGLRLQHLCRSHYISHYITNPNIFPQRKCTRMKHYTPNRNIHPQCISPYTPNGYIHAQFNSNYTPNRNIDPKCNRLCVERVYRSCTVPCFLCLLFLQNNGGNGHAHHIGIRRGIAEVPIRT